MKPLSALLLLLLLARPAAAEVPLGEGDSLVDMAYVLCRDAPDSEPCLYADALVREQTVTALLTLGASGRRAEARPLVLDFFDNPDAAGRAAAVAALAGLFPDAGDTALLAERLNDPVPAVRTAAQSALAASSDPLAARLLDRSAGEQGLSLQPDPPLDSGWLGVSLPTDAEPLRFAEDSSDGAVAFVTNQSAAEVLAYYAQLTGQPVVAGKALSKVLLPAWARGGGNAFYQELARRMQAMATLPLDQQLQLQIRMALMMALLQGVLPGELQRWQDGALWGDLRAMVLSTEPVLEMPNLLLLAYEDRLLQQTGFAFQWLPASTMPPRPEPQETGSTDTPAEPPPLDPAATEALLWQAVKASGTAADYQAYLAALPNGAHAAAARDALAALQDEATEQTQSPEQPAEEAPAPPGTPLSVTTAEGITLTVMTPILQSQPIDVSFDGLDAARSPWLAIVLAGTPDTQWTDWTYARATTGKVTLPGQRAGDYEIRTLLEAPREVVARLPVTVVSTATGPPALALADEAQKAGQPILVRFRNLPGGPSDWVAVVKAGAPDTRWDAWAYTRGKTEGELSLDGQPAGDYEIRAYTEKPKREVLVRLPLTILP